MNAQIIIFLLIIGMLAGILSGLIGVGGGIIMIPLLVLLMGFSQHQAQGTSLAALLPPVTLLAVVNYYRSGFINWKYALIIAAAFFIGGYFGSRIAVAIDQSLLKKLFGGVMLIAALKMIFGK